MDNGAFIMHRCHGTSTDVNVEATRAVTKMKATITQRFTVDGAPVAFERLENPKSNILGAVLPSFDGYFAFSPAP